MNDLEREKDYVYRERIIGMKARTEVRVNVEGRTSRITCNIQMYRASFQEAQNRWDS